MESHGPSPRSGRDDLFGVRVQVQGFKGQPYVVLNSSGPESHRDVSAAARRGGCDPGVAARRSADERRSPPGPQPTPAMLHYQKHPEILLPYDPQCNKLNFLPSAGEPERRAPPCANKPRIPLPAEGPEDLRSEERGNEAPPPGQRPPARSPNTVETESILPVGQLINQFNSTQRRGRGGPRNRLDPEQCRRSRSLDSGRTSDSSSSSSSSGRASSLRAAGVEGGAYPPGSARARLLGGQAPGARKEEEDKAFGGHNGRDADPPRVSRPRRSDLAAGGERADPERDAQVTASALAGSGESKERIYSPGVL